MVVNWFSPAHVPRGGGKVAPITLPRPLTPRDSRGISGKPSRQARTKWKIVGSSSRRENSLGLSNLKKKLVVPSSESLMTHQTIEEEVVPRRSGVRENRAHTMDDSRRPSKWQDEAVQAADTHCGLAARGRKTEKKRQAPRHECAEKHEDTINEVLKKRDCRCVRVVRPVLGVVPASSWVGRPFKCHTLLNSRCDLKRTPCTR